MIERLSDLTFVWGFLRSSCSDLREQIEESNLNCSLKGSDMEQCNCVNKVMEFGEIQFVSCMKSKTDTYV